MIKNEIVFELIKSMGKSEKRYFKLFTSKQKGNKNYLILFDAMDRQKSYDEDALVKLFSAPAVKNFNLTRQYLYSLLLKSLHGFHSGSSTDAELKENLHYVEVLFGKGLYRQCEKLLPKIKRLAYRHEKHLQILEILSWEKNLLQNQGVKLSSGKSIEDILAEEETVLKKLDNEQKYYAISNTLFKRYTTHNKARNEAEVKAYEKIVSHELCSREDKALSYNSKYEYHYIKELYYYATGDLTESYNHLKKVVSLAESHPGGIERASSRYLTALANYCYLCYLVKKYDECLEIIRKMRAIPAKSLKEKADIFRTSYIRELELYTHKGEYSKGLSIIRDVTDGMEVYRGKIGNASIVALYFYIARIYFGAENYSASLQWLNRIFNSPELKNYSVDIHCFAHIMNLVVHFELGNTDLLEYIVKSTYRFLYKRQKLYKFESMVLNFIHRKLPKIRSESQLIPVFREMRKNLIKLTEDPFEANVLDYFDFISWLESRIENKSFAEIIQQKNKGV